MGNGDSYVGEHNRSVQYLQTTVQHYWHHTMDLSSSPRKAQHGTKVRGLGALPSVLQRADA
eukprot:6205104-Pleurochrysis_carterae.AAC.3